MSTAVGLMSNETSGSSPAAFQVLDDSAVDVHDSSQPSTSFSSSASVLLTSTRPAIPILTGLRGVLAVWILIHNWRSSSAPDLLQDWWVLSGSAAVSTFFVLSGFIMAYNYGDHAFTTVTCYTSFSARRYARLMPLYYISQLICLGAVVNQAKASPPDSLMIGHYVAIALGVNTWIPWPMASPDDISRGQFVFNATLWTIQTELFFYLVFPFLLRAARFALGIRSVSGIGHGEPSVVESRAGRLLALILLFCLTSLIPTIVQCYGPQVSLRGLQVQCISTYLGPVYAAPWSRLSEFILGMLTCMLYILGVDSFSAASRPGSTSRLVRFISSHWLLHSPYVLLLTTVGLAVLLIMLGSPQWDVPGREIVFAINPGSFATGFAVLLLLLCNTGAPLSAPRQRLMGQLDVVRYVLTLPLAITMGELSFAFYAFHFCMRYYLVSIGQPVPDSIAVAFVCALGLAIPAHHYVEVPCYQWASRRLPRCDCHDDHEGLRDIHSDRPEPAMVAATVSSKGGQSADTAGNGVL